MVKDLSPAPGGGAMPERLREYFDAVRGLEVRTDPVSLVLYSTDASLYQVQPLGVVIPRNREEVQLATAAAIRLGVPLLPRGGGTSLAGQTVNEAVVVDFSRYLDRILQVEPEGRFARVEPGVVLDDLNAVLRPLGLQFGPDPASSDRASMGGIIGNNSSGAHSLLHGMAIDHLLETECLLGDGSCARFGPMEAGARDAAISASGFAGRVTAGVRDLARDHAATIRAATPRHWRRCGGYALDRFVEGVSFREPPDPRFNPALIFCGAEGTLGILTEMTVRLVELRPHRALAVLAFDRLRAALDEVAAILETGPSSVELLDHTSLELCRQAPEYARLLEGLVPGRPFCLLAVEYEGREPGEPAAGIDRLQARLGRVGAPPLTRLESPAAQARLWRIRKAGLGLMMSTRTLRKPVPFLEDAAVPVDRLGAYIDAVESFCLETGVPITYYAHASAGCLHVRPMLNLRDPEDRARIPKIQEHAVALLREMGGSQSSEHGDGRSRSWLNERMFGSDYYDLLRRVKRLCDPAGLFNPGILVDASSPLENLRASGALAPTAPDRLDFSADGGFQAAVEQCNGAAVCRRRGTGVMCPSFMVTRDEEHSPRGRANALRAVLQGRLPAEDLTGPRLAQVMDLCVECKACKSECPSAVDVAKIKIEWLARRNEAMGVPFRARLFANAWKLARIVSGPCAPGVNAALRIAPVRRLLSAVTGITPHRPWPVFAREPFSTWARNRAAASPEGGTEVALFEDEFNAAFDPDVLRAAVEVLEAAGCRVRYCGVRSSGRAALSKGLLDQARAEARDTLRRMTPFAVRGIPVVGLEPSVILSIRDEYAALLPGDPSVAVCAAACRLFEEVIADLAAAHPMPALRPGLKRILLQGHCHQKSLCGTAPVLALLRAVPGSAVEELDTTCCGMAGSFGFEAEHYRFSMAIGELKLFPAIRSAAPETGLAASGFSCRQQIFHGTGRRALHPAQIVRDHLPEDAGRGKKRSAHE
jgi:FAD/FMN-containing dehydrogenase/Fe-S oxidoreductase